MLSPIRHRLAVPLLPLVLWATAATTAAQARRDQVYVRDARKPDVIEAVGGQVTESSLNEVVVELPGGEQRTIPTERVVRVALGNVSSYTRDGRALYERSAGDLEPAARARLLEDAIAKLRTAADDTSLSPVERAFARLTAARAYVAFGGAVDPSHFKDAVTQADRLISDFPASRLVPAARQLAARASWLGGDAETAAGRYRDLLQEASGENVTSGYSLTIAYGAGVEGGHAALMAKDSLLARELFGAVEGALGGVLAGLGEDDPERAALGAILARARAGEGYVLLANAQTGEARSRFESLLSEAETQDLPALRFSAIGGLAEVSKAEGDNLTAQIDFSKVSALAHGDRDLRARALVGMAECALAMGSSEGRSLSRTWLETVRSDYSDTPSASTAKSLLETL